MTPRRPCKKCGLNRAERFFTSPRGNTCADCRRKTQRDSTHANRILNTYGLTPGDYQRLLEYQGGACAICRGTRSYRLNVDHCHRTGKVRGLLCRRCNKLLRDVRDDTTTLRGAAVYLFTPPADELGIVAIAASAAGGGSND